MIFKDKINAAYKKAPVLEVTGNKKVLWYVELISLRIHLNYKNIIILAGMLNEHCPD